MPKIVKPLTDTQIRKAKPKDKPYKLFDGNGLYVEIRKTGKKIFRLKYDNKTLTIGEYPFVTLSEAREFVKKKKREKSALNSKKFNQVCEEFFEKKKEELSEKHHKLQQRRVEMYMQNLLSKKIDEINKSDVVQVLLNAKTNELKKRVFLLLRQIMRFAYARDYIENNVCDKIDLNEFVVKKEQKHLKAIVDEKEFKELVKTIWNLNEIYDVYINIHLAFKFLILTALRNGNVRGLMWEWINFDEKVIIFPAKEMKNKKEFRLPLTDTLIEILKEAGVRNEGIVFHSYSEKNRKLSDMAFNMILRRLGITNHTTHGFRSSFSTICYKHFKSHGFSSEVIETQLAHSVGSSIVRAYQRGDFLEERRELLEWWESFILN